MAKLFVDHPFGHLAAVHVRDRKREGQRRDRRAQHLEAVPENNEHVRPTARERVGEARDPDADRAGDRVGRVRVEAHLDALVDLPARILDERHGATESWRQVAARHEQEEVQIGRGANLLEERKEVPPVRTGHRDDPDGPPHRVAL